LISLRGKTYKHRCPDGSTKIVHRNVDDAFPLALKDLEVRFAAELNAMAAGIAGGVKTDVKKSISGWLFQLNEQNQSLMASFRAIYTGYQSDPCLHGKAYMRAVERTVEEVNLQTRTQAQIKGLVALAQSEGVNHDEVMRQFSQICGVGDVPAAASKAINAAVDDAQTWLQEGRQGDVVQPGEPNAG
jgi:hypothetical protein